MVHQAYSYAGLPPMLTNARFRSILLAWVLLVLTAATLLIARSWTTNEGDSYYTTYIPSPRKWASAWGQLGNADSPVLHSLQALQWKGDHPGAVDKFEESSLERWTKGTPRARESLIFSVNTLTRSARLYRTRIRPRAQPPAAQRHVQGRRGVAFSPPKAARYTRVPRVARALHANGPGVRLYPHALG